jgi:hypothetical protein
VPLLSRLEPFFCARSKKAVPCFPIRPDRAKMELENKSETEKGLDDYSSRKRIERAASRRKRQGKLVREIPKRLPRSGRNRHWDRNIPPQPPFEGKKWGWKTA